jgi:hypothetical protein
VFVAITLDFLDSSDAYTSDVEGACGACHGKRTPRHLRPFTSNCFPHGFSSSLQFHQYQHDCQIRHDICKARGCIAKPNVSALQGMNDPDWAQLEEKVVTH